VGQKSLGTKNEAEEKQMKRWARTMAMGAAMLAASSMNLWAVTPGDNAQVAEQVRKQIVTLPFYSIFDNVQFALADGALVLSGVVYRPVMKKMIERATERVEGVKSVTNNIEILPLSSFDDRIRVALARQLFSNQVFTRLGMQAVPPVHIVVKNGNVTLEGVVSSQLEKNVAFHIANGIHGVFSVTNNLRTES
jgi:hyperosmotically inducible protein